MPDAANELWKAIADLSETIGGLKASVDQNSRAQDKQSESIQKQAQSIDVLAQRSEAQFKAIDTQIAVIRRIADVLRGTRIQMPGPEYPEEAVIPGQVTHRHLPWWYPLSTPILLTIIAIILWWYLAMGGHL